MRRLCGGIYKYELIWPGKIEALFQLISDRYVGKKLIIWCNFTDEIDYLQNYLMQNGLTCTTVSGKITNKKERERRRISFNDGPIQYFIAQPECFKFGTDLSGAAAMVFFSTPPGGLTRTQAEDRIIKIGKGGAVTIWDLVVKNTVEEDLLDGLIRKENHANTTHAAIKKIQERHRGISKKRK